MLRCALILSLGLAVLGCQQAEDASTADQANPLTVEDADQGVLTAETQQVAFTEGDTATLEVPKMMCPFACYPQVKETLEGIEGIKVVELVPQKEEGAIDDRRVTVTFAADVNGAEATSALEKAGFGGAKFQ